jgi:hypothetical protein
MLECSELNWDEDIVGHESEDTAFSSSNSKHTLGHSTSSPGLPYLTSTWTVSNCKSTPDSKAQALPPIPVLPLSISTPRNGSMSRKQKRMTDDSCKDLLPHLDFPQPPPLPSLAQMALAFREPDYRSPTYSIYGLYDDAVAQARRRPDSEWIAGAAL